MEIIHSQTLPCRWHKPLFNERALSVCQIGRQMFQDTHLVRPGVIAAHDLVKANTFFQVTIPDSTKYPNLSNWFGKYGLVEHTDFAAAIAYKLAEELNKTGKFLLNPCAHGAALKLHDLGRTTTHAFMETDVMTDCLWKMIGLRDDIHKLTHSASLYWDDVETPPKELTIAQKISIIADTAGKRSSNDSDRLRLVEEIIPSVQEGKKKYIDKPNPTYYEKMMVEKLPQYARREKEAIEYTLVWFSEQGINLNSIIQPIKPNRLS